MTRVMVLALFMYATLYAGMAKSREECATAADPTKCMAGSDGEVLLQSKLAVDQKDIEEDGLDAEEDEDVEGLGKRGFQSLLIAMPLVLSNISNYSALYSTQTLERVDVVHAFGKDKASDTRLLLEMVDGFVTLMQEEVLDKDDKACPSDSVDAINGCLARAMCLLQFYVDGDGAVRDKSDMRKYALLEELYTRFQDMTWPQTMSMLGVGEVYDPTKAVGYASPNQHSCDADAAWDKEESSLLETSTQMAAAYQRSKALVSATKATHAIMDAHTHNSSVEATVAALHGAWKPACELLECDGANYRDLWRASHAHSSNLIEMGASARHMRVHIRTRQRLELRMQQFLGEHGAKLHDKVHKDAATSWRSAPKQYFAQGRGALLQTVIRSVANTDAPLSTRVYPLRLIDGQKLEQSLLEQGKHQSLKFLRSEAALLADGDTKVDASEGGAWGRIGKSISKSGNAVGNFATPGWDDFEKGVDSGKNAIKGVTEASGLNIIPGTKGIEGEAAKLNFGKYVSAVTFTKDLITTKIAAKVIDGLEPLGNDVSAVTTKFAQAAADAAQEAARFMLSLLNCAGAYAEGYTHGYGTKIPDDAMARAYGVWPMGVAMAFGTTVDDPESHEGIANLLNKEALGDELSVAISIVFGACPGLASHGGIRSGMGVTAGFGCNSGQKNPSGGPDCGVELKLGATGSALIPSKGCIGTAADVPGFKCFFGYSVTVTILCCNFWVISGIGDCR